MKRFLGKDCIQELINIVKDEFKDVKADVSKLKSDLETKITSSVSNHANNKNNPHGVTIAQIGAAASGHTHSNATTSANGFMSKEDKVKLNGIANSANNYTHPTSHPATMITQDATHRFVTDTEKSTWSGKANSNHNHDSTYLKMSPFYGSNYQAPANWDKAGLMIALDDSTPTNPNAASFAKTNISSIINKLNDTYLKKSGGEVGPVTVNGDVRLGSAGGETRKIIGRMSSNDAWMIAAHGNGDGSSETGNGALEIATGDDGTEPIMVSQYHNSNIDAFDGDKRTAYLLDANGNTSFPGTVKGTGFEVTGDISFPNYNGVRGIYGRMADNDGWRIIGNGSGDAGYLEIATADNGSEPIYVRQYDDQGYVHGNVFSHVKREVTLLNETGNSIFPGQLCAPSVIITSASGLGISCVKGSGKYEASLFINSGTLYLDCWVTEGSAATYARAMEIDMKTGKCAIKGCVTESDINTLKSNFQDGCNKIASAIAAAGISGGSSPDEIVSRIGTLNQQKVNAQNNASNLQSQVNSLQNQLNNAQSASTSNTAYGLSRLLSSGPWWNGQVYTMKSGSGSHDIIITYSDSSVTADDTAEKLITGLGSNTHVVVNGVSYREVPFSDYHYKHGDGWSISAKGWSTGSGYVRLTATVSYSGGDKISLALLNMGIRLKGRDTWISVAAPLVGFSGSLYDF